MSSINPETGCLNLDLEYEAPNFRGYYIHQDLVQYQKSTITSIQKSSGKVNSIQMMNISLIKSQHLYSIPNSFIFFNISLYSCLQKRYILALRTDCTKFWKFEHFLTVLLKSPETREPGDYSSGISQPRQTLFRPSVFSEQGETGQTEHWIEPPGNWRNKIIFQRKTFDPCIDQSMNLNILD